jgi:hypothetical protein
LQTKIEAIRRLLRSVDWGEHKPKHAQEATTMYAVGIAVPTINHVRNSFGLEGIVVRVSDREDPAIVDPTLAQVAALEKAESELGIKSTRTTGVRLISRF